MHIPIVPPSPFLRPKDPTANMTGEQFAAWLEIKSQLAVQGKSLSALSETSGGALLGAFQTLSGGRRLCLGRKRIRLPKVQPSTFFGRKKSLEDEDVPYAPRRSQESPSPTTPPTDRVDPPEPVSMDQLKATRQEAQNRSRNALASRAPENPIPVEPPVREEPTQPKESALYRIKAMDPTENPNGEDIVVAPAPPKVRETPLKKKRRGTVPPTIEGESGVAEETPAPPTVPEARLSEDAAPVEAPETLESPVKETDAVVAPPTVGGESPVGDVDVQTSPPAVDEESPVETTDIETTPPKVEGDRSDLDERAESEKSTPRSPWKKPDPSSVGQMRKIIIDAARRVGVDRVTASHAFKDAELEELDDETWRALGEQGGFDIVDPQQARDAAKEAGTHLPYLEDRLTGKVPQEISAPVILIDKEGNPQIVSGAAGLLAARAVGVRPQVVVLDFSVEGGAAGERERRNRAIMEGARQSREKARMKEERSEKEQDDELLESGLAEDANVETVAEQLGLSTDDYDKQRRAATADLREKIGTMSTYHTIRIMGERPKVASWVVDNYMRGQSPTKSEAEAFNDFLAQADQGYPFLYDDLEGKSYADIPKMLERHFYQKDVPFVLDVGTLTDPIVRAFDQQVRQLLKSGTADLSIRQISVPAAEWPRYGINPQDPFFVQGADGIPISQGEVVSVRELPNGNRVVTFREDQDALTNRSALLDDPSITSNLKDEVLRFAEEDSKYWDERKVSHDAETLPDAFDVNDIGQVRDRINNLEDRKAWAKERRREIEEEADSIASDLSSEIEHRLFQEMYDEATQERQDRIAELLDEMKDREMEIKEEVEESLRKEIERKELKQIKKEVWDEAKRRSKRDGTPFPKGEDLQRLVDRAVNDRIDELRDDALQKAMDEDPTYNDLRSEEFDLNWEDNLDKKEHQKKLEELRDQIHEKVYESLDDEVADAEANDEELNKLFQERDTLDQLENKYEDEDDRIQPLREWLDHLEARRKTADPRGWREAYEIGYTVELPPKPDPNAILVGEETSLADLFGDQLFDEKFIAQGIADYSFGGRLATEPNAAKIANALSKWRDRSREYFDAKKEVDKVSLRNRRFYNLGKSDREYARGRYSVPWASDDSLDARMHEWAANHYSGAWVANRLRQMDAGEVLDSIKQSAQHSDVRSDLSNAIKKSIFRDWQSYLKGGGLGGEDELNESIDKTLRNLFRPEDEGEWWGLERLAREHPTLAKTIRQHPLMDPKHPRRVAREAAKKIPDLGAIPPSIRMLATPSKNGLLIDQAENFLEGRALLDDSGNFIYPPDRKYDPTTGELENTDAFVEFEDRIHNQQQEIVRWLEQIAPSAPVNRTTLKEVVREVARRIKEGTDKKFATKSLPSVPPSPFLHRTKTLSAVNPLLGGVLIGSRVPTPKKKQPSIIGPSPFLRRPRSLAVKPRSTV